MPRAFSVDNGDITSRKKELFQALSAHILVMQGKIVKFETK